MSRTSERMGTKADWRRGKSNVYGIAAHRRVRESNRRAVAETLAAQDRKEQAS